jgi:hypothetical protein
VRPLGHAALGFAGLALAATLAGCGARGDETARAVDAGRAGDRILDLAGARVENEQATIDRTLKSIAALLDQLPLPAERKQPLASLRPTHVVQGGRGFEIAATTDSIVLATSDVDVGWASNAIIVATGAIRVAHCKNSVVLSARDVQMSHDGSDGNGSLAIAKGNMVISNARNTLIYAVQGVEIERANGVRAFNTPALLSSGGIDNTVIEPLFRK